MTGGGHERGFRSGTSNVPAIVGFGVAARRMRPAEAADRSRGLLDRLLEGLVDAEPFTVLSDHAIGLPNTLNVRFHGADAEAVIANAPEICISTGSACTAAVPEPSHVLIAMGLPAEHAFEVDAAADALRRAVSRVRSLDRSRTVGGTA
jgi:cysteine desulfurase